jgi:hypothetical protein
MLMYIDILSSRVPSSPGTPYHQLYVKSTPLTSSRQGYKSCYIQIVQLSFVLPLVGVCCSHTELAYSIDGRTKVVYAAAFTSFGQECILRLRKPMVRWLIQLHSTQPHSRGYQRQQIPWSYIQLRLKLDQPH